MNARKTGESKNLPNHLIFCEHPHVYTLGKSGDVNNLLLAENELQSKGAKYYKINRGGDITYHGPGQIVAYPILDLENFFTDIHKYLRFLEEAVIRTCASYGVKAGRVDGLTGVWVDYEDVPNARKICAMGVRCSRWITMHGLAFNINPNLSYFGNIVPCGIQDKAVTSLELETSSPINLKSVQEELTKHLVDLFGFELKTTNLS
jgi:lipoyl(octanoyl) transferase